jgi:hypothetical protein
MEYCDESGGGMQAEKGNLRSIYAISLTATICGGGRTHNCHIHQKVIHHHNHHLHESGHARSVPFYWRVRVFISPHLNCGRSIFLSSYWAYARNFFPKFICIPFVERDSCTVIWILELYCLYRIWGFHSGDYEKCRLLVCGAVYILCEQSFRRNVSPPSSG